MDVWRSRQGQVKLRNQELVNSSVFLRELLYLLDMFYVWLFFLFQATLAEKGLEEKYYNSISSNNEYSSISQGLTPKFDAANLSEAETLLEDWVVCA